MVHIQREMSELRVRSTENTETYSKYGICLAYHSKNGIYNMIRALNYFRQKTVCLRNA